MPIPDFPSVFTRRLAFALAAAWTALVIALSLMPSPPRMPAGLDWDKAQHALAYAFLCWWWLQALEGRRPVRLALALAAVGVGIELLQGLSLYRSFQFADMLANVIGIGLGLLVCRTPLGRVLPNLAGIVFGRGSARE